MHDPNFNCFWDNGSLKAENRQFCVPWPWNPGQGHSRLSPVRLSILVPMESACTHHRLRGSASPVLTATHHSYGSFAWLSDFFFRPTSGGQTPQPILTQNGSNDVHSRKDVPFAVKVATFHTPWSPGPHLEIFRSILGFNIRGYGENTPYSSSEPIESGIVNRQSGGENWNVYLNFT